MGSAMFNKVFRTTHALSTDRVSQFILGHRLLEGKADEAARLLEAFTPTPWPGTWVCSTCRAGLRRRIYLNRAIGSGNREAVENLKILKGLWSPSGTKSANLNHIIFVHHFINHSLLFLLTI